MSLQLELETWARHALRGKKFVTIYEVARMLGVSTRTAGKILRRLEDLGLVERWSRRAYRVRSLAARPVEAEHHAQG